MSGKKGKSGRPPIRTPEMEKRIFELYRMGLNTARVARSVGISSAAISYWKTHDSLFSSGLQAAKDDGELMLLEVLRKKAIEERDSVDAKWLLSKQFWRRYGDRQRIDATVQHDIGSENTAKLLEVWAKLRSG